MPSALSSGEHASSSSSDTPRDMSSAVAASQQVSVSQQHHDRKIATSPQRKLDRHSWEYITKSGIAGGLAGCAGKTVVGPLDRVKILFQASNPQFMKYSGTWTGFATALQEIYKQDGGRGLFRGHSATLLRIFPYAGIKFLAYEQIRAKVIRNKSQETPLRRILSGSLAGCMSVFFTYPLEVIRVRLAFETRRDARPTLSSICRRIYNEHPPRVTASSTQINTSSAAEVASSTITATAATIQRTIPTYGLANFFRGFVPTLVGMVPYAGSSFFAHDTMGDLMRQPKIAAYTILPGTEGRGQEPHKPAQLKVWAELTSGGVAGLFSQTVSYPFEVIRRRMQVGGVVGDGHRLGMIEVAKKIRLEKGWRGFYVGLAIGYIKIIPMTATSFFVYERGKYYLGI